MNTLKKLERLFITGVISEEEYLEQFEVHEKRSTTKTVEGIIAYLKSELNEAIELHNKAQENKDMQLSITLLIKAHTISELLENIKDA